MEPLAAFGNNAESKKRGRAYKKAFGDLPTVDSVADGLGSADFVNCSWRVNDARNDLALREFRELCTAVLAYWGADSDMAPSLARVG